MSKAPHHGFEDYARDDDVTVGSERAFGLVFAAVFVIIALWPLADGEVVRLWALGVGAVFLVLAFLYSRALRPFNIVWFKFGLLLHKIVNPIIMGLMFYVTIMPAGLIMRALGKDPLQRRFDKQAESYWIDRTPPGPAPETMKNQF